ncbi:unnamed protein product [Colias eurytheme]|nr:unnamed protein product [Colias eurytheme]
MKKAKGKAAGGTASKPLCDCPTCKCKKCPDVVKLLSSSLTDSKPNVSKLKKGKEKKCKLKITESKPSNSSLLGILKDRNDCNCEVVAKAVQDDVHMNLGMSSKRKEVNRADNIEDTD